MKRHKQFRTALSVSIQERREQYPDMTDSDVEKAIKAIVTGVERARIKRAKRVALPNGSMCVRPICDSYTCKLNKLRPSAKRSVSYPFA